MESIQQAIAFSNNLQCEHCGQPFEPRSGSGGKPQRFCSSECRAAFHAKTQGSQRSGDEQNVGEVPETLGTSSWREALEESDCDFDWNNDEAVVLKEQLAVAIYWNDDDGLVIRQARNWNDEFDTVIVIARNNIGDFIDRLAKVAGRK